MNITKESDDYNQKSSIKNLWFCTIFIGILISLGFGINYLQFI